MAKRFERYRVKRGDDLGSADFWNQRLEDIDARIAAREIDGAKIDEATANLIATALTRVNDTFLPVLNEAIARLNSVGALFEAESDTANEVGTGAKTFVLSPATREGYVVTDYVIVSNADETASLIGKTTSYDRANGLLIVDALAVTGEGTFADWKVRVSAPPDLDHATRTDNPHQVTAAQVGAYTTAETDSAIDVAIAALRDGVSSAFDTFKEVADFIGSLGSAATHDAVDFATSEQGALAATAVQPESLPEPTPLHGQCEIVYDDGELRLIPKDGNKLIVDGVSCAIPDGGVVLPATGLTPDTTYYVYATATAGIVDALVPSETAHSPQAGSGVEIETGAATRTLVGMARCLTGPAWSSNPLLVRSWFNRQQGASSAVQTVSHATTSTALVLIDAEMRVEFLVWADEVVNVSLNGAGQASSGQVGKAAISLDGAAPSDSLKAAVNNLVSTCVISGALPPMSEGFHDASMFASVTAGAVTFAGNYAPNCLVVRI